MEDLRTFVAIDFETATPNMMACQVGIVSVVDGEIVETFSSYIKPPKNEYGEYNIRVHHITPDMTENAPTFEELWPTIERFFLSPVLVAHNMMNTDIHVLYANLDYYGIMYMAKPKLVCTCDLYGRRGLEDMCAAFGMDCDNHHDGLFDALCCAKFYLNYLSGVEPDYSLVPEKKKPKYSRSKKQKEDGLSDLDIKDFAEETPANPFFDKKVLITGEFDFSRSSLKKQLEKMGAKVMSSVSKKLHYVIVGREPGLSKIEELSKLDHNGFKIRQLSEEEVLQIFRGQWDGYAIDGDTKKELDFSIDHYEQHHKDLDGLVNRISTKNIYVGKDLSGDRRHFAQIIGNLGGYADNDIYNDTHICLLSDSSIKKLRGGIKDETVLYIEQRYNTSKAITYDWDLLSEGDILAFCKRFCDAYDAEETLELYEKYIKAR